MGTCLDEVPATLDVLAEIAKHHKGKMKIFIDGGVRTGADILKAIALGADACLIGRPYVTAVYGGGQEGVKVYNEKNRERVRICNAYDRCNQTRKKIEMSKIRFI